MSNMQRRAFLGGMSGLSKRETLRSSIATETEWKYSGLCERETCFSEISTHIDNSKRMIFFSPTKPVKVIQTLTLELSNFASPKPSLKNEMYIYAW